MKNIIFIAPPAAGKGTQASMISKHYNIPNISTGDLLRDARECNDERSIIISELIDAGKFVPDEIVFDILKERIIKEDCNNGFILDGFPRNLNQAYKYEKLLEDLNKSIGLVIQINLDKEIAKQRIIGRLTCPQCGKIYNKNVGELKPIVDNICDNCNVELKHRNDDVAATYEIRYETYMEQTKPLIDFYKSKNILFNVDGNTSKENIYNLIVNTIDNN